MKDEKNYVDLHYLYKRDEILKMLLDNDLHYSLYDIKKIKNILNLLYKYLKKGSKNE